MPRRILHLSATVAPTARDEPHAHASGRVHAYASYRTQPHTIPTARTAAHASFRAPRPRAPCQQPPPSTWVCALQPPILSPRSTAKEPAIHAQRYRAVRGWESAQAAQTGAAPTTRTQYAQRHVPRRVLATNQPV